MTGAFHKVLIIDDDSHFAEHLAGLMPRRYQVKTAYSTKQAMEQLTRYPFDSIVSDFVLADHDGLEFLKTIKSLANPPKIIFITAFANKDMAISLLNQGIHGLLEKPFPVSILTELLDKESGPSKGAAWRLDPATRAISTPTDDFELTEVEFRIVSCLLNNLGKWITREELLEQIWGNENRSRNVLDTHLTNLKRKVPPLKEAIKVVRGRGYLLEKSKNE